MRAYPGPSRFMLVLLASLKAGFSPFDLGLGLEVCTAVKTTSTGSSVDWGAGDLAGINKLSHSK